METKKERLAALIYNSGDTLKELITLQDDYTLMESSKK
jgi:hypothetical protein